jgi:ribosomal protein S18 acetylase RimI-like enzyme
VSQKYESIAPLFIRQATLEDAEIVLEILNSENNGVDPDQGNYGIDIAKNIIQSPGDPSATWLFSDNENAVPFGVGNLHPDLSTKALEPTLAVRWGDSRYPVLLDWFILEAQRDYPDFKIQIVVSQKHSENLAHASSRGFLPIRFYNTLRAHVAPNLEPPSLPEGVVIRNADLNDKSDLRKVHSILQNSFSENFGFVPRDFDPWVKRFKADKSVPSDGVYLLEYLDSAEGFIWLDDIDALELRGFVDRLGVNKEHHGKGFGQLLLGTALAHFSSRGYLHADLGVDTQNASNALRVYEKMGFVAISTGVELERPVTISSGL